MSQEKQPQKLSSNSKSHKIHRRKNQQITKQFMCTEGCGKAYGSYAALYTHIKNKHGQAKPPEMKNNKPKVGRKGRPQTKQSDGNIQEPDGQCKICNQSPCQCIQKFDTQQKKKILEIMSNQDFVNFVNQVGGLYKSIQNVFIRNTQQDFNQYTEEKIKLMLEKFNKKFNKKLQISSKMLSYLAFSSQYWNMQNIQELYNGIFGIKSNLVVELFLKQNQESFPNLLKCAQYKDGQFQAFVIVINNI